MDSTLKAFMVYGYDIQHGCVLVLAKNRGRAITIGRQVHEQFYEPLPRSDYHAFRRKQWDGALASEGTIETDNEMPDGYPPFYDQDDDF